jgi:hypothetical protein
MTTICTYSTTIAEASEANLVAALNRLEDYSPERLVGTLLNSIGEYFRADQDEADNATWKGRGQECIDPVFYAFVSRNVYGRTAMIPYPGRQHRTPT